MREHLDSPLWKDAKSLALSMTSLPDFWSSPERHAVLGEVEYRERVETGLEAASRLLPRIVPHEAGPREHYPRKLVGQAAGRLQLLEMACRSLERGTPWEAIVLIESMQGPAAEDPAADQWIERLGSMYQQWGRKRKMRIKVLENVAASGIQLDGTVLQAIDDALEGCYTS